MLWTYLGKFAFANLDLWKFFTVKCVDFGNRRSEVAGLALCFFTVTIMHSYYVLSPGSLATNVIPLVERLNCVIGFGGKGPFLFMCNAWLILCSCVVPGCSLTTTACKTIVLSLVILCLDFGNATLYGISKTLLHRRQVVQNSAARLIMRVHQCEHINPVLFALHWLPIRQHIQFKILTLVYRCQNHQAPAYLSTCITSYVPGRSL